MEDPKIKYLIVQHGAQLDEWLQKFRGRFLSGWEVTDEGLILDFCDVGLLLKFPMLVQEVVRPNPHGIPRNT